MKRTKLFEMLNQRIEENHIKHVQLLLRTKNDRRIARFISCDNNHYKETVKHICDDFPESMKLFDETPTTISYLI